MRVQLEDLVFFSFVTVLALLRFLGNFTQKVLATLMLFLLA